MWNICIIRTWLGYTFFLQVECLLIKYFYEFHTRMARDFPLVVKKADCNTDREIQGKNIVNKLRFGENG